MIFTKTKLGACIITLEKKEDQRGFLIRTLDKKKFAEIGIDFEPVEAYVTMSKKKGTIRGFHYLIVSEKKLTRVLRGTAYEVIIDLRPDSLTYKKFEAFTFTDSDYKMLYLPPGFAHAILSLEDETELMSLYNPAYESTFESGIRFDDPAFSIAWPIPVVHVSEKDKTWKDFQPL